MEESNADVDAAAAVKVTYLGEQDKPVASLLISSTSVSAPMDLFTELGSTHSNDTFGVIHLTVDQASMNAIVRLTRNHAGTEGAAGAERAQVAVSLINIDEGSYSTSLLGAADAGRYFDDLQRELAGAEDVTAKFGAWRARTNL